MCQRRIAWEKPHTNLRTQVIIKKLELLIQYKSKNI